MPVIRLAALFLSLAALAGGCRFAREVVNPHVRELDTAWIRPGRTTRAEIVDRLGMPPMVRELGGVGKDSFRWTCCDTFTRTLEAGYIVTPTFERGRERFAEDILIRFDDRGVVTLVSRTRTRYDRIEVVEWREAER